jgi:methionyl-tRNA synthetase
MQPRRGQDAYLLTGTDEHGEKVLRTAIANQTEAQEWTDNLVNGSWLPLLETIDIDNQDFIRTTEERHKLAVQKFLNKLYEDGFIYQGSYQGNYCVGCEEYKADSDLVDGEGEYEGTKVCAIHSKPVETLNETNYFFKLSEFQKPLLDLYQSQADFVQPESAKNEVVSFVSRGLEDLSISRSKEKFDWGVDIPWDDSHVTYVWFDALLNYITALGYGDDEALLDRYWPADVQVVGKDILRFHAVIWPAMLMAAGLEPPKQIFGHGWLLVGGEKMSKSKLTGIAPEQITDVFGSDAFRYYFMRAISFGSDGSFSWEDLSARYQAELANGFGNLASRVVSMVDKYFESKLPSATDYTEPEKQLIAIAQAAALNADRAMDRGAIHEAIAASWTLVDELNNYITQQEPWKVAKDDAQRNRLATILYSSAEGLRILSVLLAPIMPKATEKLFASIWPGKDLSEQTIADAAQWGGLPAGVEFEKLESLFPRIEQE